ncbi:MAG: hypothetical protein M1820_002561 [Bogoriella megaspora]|nr:MAG: hypothetical protein M1820_002561 [Bogoriella megaspora]
MASANVMPAAAIPTSSYPYSYPPPPYNQPNGNSSSSAPGLPGIKSPPPSKWSPKDEKEQKPATRQSLPSIHEALGSNQPLPYSTSAAPPPPPSSSAPQAYQSQTIASPSENARRSYTSDNSQQSLHYPQPPRSPATDRPHPVTGNQSVPAESQRPSFPGASSSKLPALHPIQTSRSPQMPPAPPPSNVPYSYPSQSSPAYASAPPQTPPSSHPSQFPYGYAQRSSQYPYPPPASGYTSQPPQRYGLSWSDPSDALSRAEESKRAGSVRGPAFGESVKRHLEFFDYEASLNEIAESSALTLDFARTYQQRAHQTQRSGPVPGSLPELGAIEDLARRSAKLTEAWNRIKDVVVAQEAARAQQAQARQYSDPNEYENAESNGLSDDLKGQGYAGGDSKKPRRGRAAPPGRCHSCNRAETPEWRRGPDGARTLCNACGLHYAKLTRKMGTTKANNLGSSNLRPKEMGPGSPVP